MIKMKNILAENLLRFGVKNLSESNQKHLSMLTEANDINKIDWANKQTMAIKNLTAQYNEGRWPISPVVIGPYCLITANNIAGLSKQKIEEGSNYMGDVIAWVGRAGLPSPLSKFEASYFSFHPANKFQNFNVGTDKLGNDIKYLNSCYNELPLDILQAMWKSIGQATELSKMMPALKTNVLAYQKNPMDATKGYDQITGNAAAFLKSLKFA